MFRYLIIKVATHVIFIAKHFRCTKIGLITYIQSNRKTTNIQKWESCIIATDENFESESFQYHTNVAWYERPKIILLFSYELPGTLSVERQKFDSFLHRKKSNQIYKSINLTKSCGMSILSILKMVRRL